MRFTPIQPPHPYLLPLYKKRLRPHSGQRSPPIHLNGASLPAQQGCQPRRLWQNKHVYLEKCDKQKTIVLFVKCCCCGAPW